MRTLWRRLVEGRSQSLTPQDEDALLSVFEAQAIPVLAHIAAAFEAKERALDSEIGATYRVSSVFKGIDNRFRAVDLIKNLLFINRDDITDVYDASKHATKEIGLQDNTVIYLRHEHGAENEQGSTYVGPARGNMPLSRVFALMRTSKETSRYGDKRVLGIQKIADDIANTCVPFERLSSIDQDFLKAVAAYDDFCREWLEKTAPESSRPINDAADGKNDKRVVQERLIQVAERQYGNKYGAVAAAARRFADKERALAVDRETVGNKARTTTHDQHVQELLQQARNAGDRAASK